MKSHTPADSFVAIDVETANSEPSSICSIGAVKVENGVITGHFHELVSPDPDYFSYFNIRVHGITAADTADARNFADVWADVRRFIGDLPLVAHNAPFDSGCIRAAHRCYGMDYPDYTFHCSLSRARRTIPRALCSSFSLPHLCNFLGIPFTDHHNALADAEAAAKIWLAIGCG